MHINEILAESKEVKGKSRYAKLLLRKAPVKYAIMELIAHIVEQKPTSILQIASGINQHVENIDVNTVRNAISELVSDGRIQKLKSKSGAEIYQAYK